MKHLSWLIFALILWFALPANASPIGNREAPAIQATPTAPDALRAHTLRISQVYGGGGASSSAPSFKCDYIELFNAGDAPVSLAGWSVQYGAATGAAGWNVHALPALTVLPHTYLLLQEGCGVAGGNLPAADVIGSLNLSATQGKVALVNQTTALNGACPAGPHIADLVGYGDTNCKEGATPIPALSITTAAIRAAGGCQDTGDNGADFARGAPDPRHRAAPPLACTLNAALQTACPGAISTRAGRAVFAAFSAGDADGKVVAAAMTGHAAAGVALAEVSPAISRGGVLTGSLTIGPTLPPGVYTIGLTFANDDMPAPQTATCDVTVTVGDGVCPAATITPIATIQGSGDTSPLLGQKVVIRGAVVGSFPGATGLNGFFVQDGGDGDPQTSDGLFVYAPAALPVRAGDMIQATGVVTEFNHLTELGNVTAVSLCGDPLTIRPVALTLPETVNGELERFEGMLVAFRQMLTVSQNYFQGRYGQVTLSADGRMYHPTNGNGLGDTFERNARRMLVLDDGRSGQNPAPIPYLAADHTLRVGDTVTGLVGVLDHGPINASFPFSYDYRLQPTQPVTFARMNPRPVAPDPVGGNLKIAAANTLNYFTTLDTGAAICGPAKTLECRGANSAAELQRQRAKLIAALQVLDADIVGLMEIENTDDVAIADLVAGLNEKLGADAYAFVKPTAPGADAIRVELIYKPARVTPVGPAQNYQTSTPIYKSLFDRPPLAQTFRLNANGEQFTVIVNHFKSKGSCPTAAGSLDLDAGQGCWNAKRTAQAQGLLDFIGALQQTDPDVLVVGDLNGYGVEDPLKVMIAGGLVSLDAQVPAASRYTYVFDGQAGNLDHALATASLNARLTGVTIWHVNTDEPVMLDYNQEFKPQDLYAATPYRYADHDPIVVGLELIPATRPGQATLGGRVWHDVNADGVYDPGEPALAGVTLALRTAADRTTAAVVITATSAADGRYRFAAVAPGNYWVEVIAAARELAGLALPVGQFHPLGPFAVREGDPYEAADLGYVSACAPGQAAIVGAVWQDTDRDAAPHPAEPGISGVRVCAVPLGFLPIRCATTDAASVYALCLAPARYLLLPAFRPFGQIPLRWFAFSDSLRAGQRQVIAFGYRPR